MIERLVENWLDSASERSFQSVFCQILVARGYRVLHSTRHAAVEFGKDVVALDPDGRPCAFQLKGNPGSRLTLDQFRKIEPQLHELVVYVLTGPGIPDVPHRSFLVTNGLIEEETRLAIEKMNASYLQQGFGRSLEVIQRGELLQDALELGEALWPAELEDVHLLLDLLVMDGRELYPLGKSHRLLLGILGLAQDSRQMSAPELRRRITSAAIFTAVALKRFDAAGNHFAAIQAWVMFATYAIAACEKHGRSFEEVGREAVDIASATVFERLSELVVETIEHETLAEGNLMVDSVAYGARYLLLLGTLSCFWHWAERVGWPEDVSKESVRQFLISRSRRSDLWGEGALPQLIAYYWFLRSEVESAAAEGLLIGMIDRLLAGIREKGEGLPSPYWTFDDITRHRLSPLLGGTEDPLKKETVGMSSYFLEGLLLLLVRTNRKSACRSLWPDISRMNLQSFRVLDRWSYPLWRTDNGAPTTTIPPPRQEWRGLVERARSISCPDVPAELVARPWLLLLMLLSLPFRSTPSVLARLGYEFDKGWYIADPIEPE